MCGGTAIVGIPIIGKQGLSPRVRGNLSPPVQSGPYPGSIPRVCGGTNDSWYQDAKDLGLSPRVRGNHSARSCWNVKHRSIPACAGEPADANDAIFVDGVYPRVCGGTYDSLVPGREGLGSIPACAGEPHSSFLPSKLVSVYPRVCGGTTLPDTSTPSTVGLSPRVRGNLR